GPQREDAVLVHATRSARIPVLLLEDQPSDQIGVLSPVDRRPVDDRPTLGGEPALPLAMLFEALARVERWKRTARYVGVEPRARLVAEGFLARRERQVHRRTSLTDVPSAPSRARVTERRRRAALGC